MRVTADFKLKKLVSFVIAFTNILLLSIEIAF